MGVGQKPGQPVCSKVWKPNRLPAQPSEDCSINASTNDGTAHAAYEKTRRHRSTTDPARAAASVPIRRLKTTTSNPAAASNAAVWPRLGHNPTVGRPLQL